MQNPIWGFESKITSRLLVWSILSVLSGLWGWFGRGFGIQCVAWGCVDAAIAFVSARSAARRKSTVDPKREAQNIRKILWVNFGLDILYILGGFLLTQKYPASFWQGTGWGIILQGGFLFFFDLYHALSVPATEAK